MGGDVLPRDAGLGRVLRRSVLAVKISPRERAVLEEAAAVRGLRLSSFVRTGALEAAGLVLAVEARERVDTLKHEERFGVKPRPAKKGSKVCVHDTPEGMFCYRGCGKV